MTESSKTITWQDPRPGAARARTMSGLDYVREIVQGRIMAAPIAAHVTMRGITVEQGDVVLEGTPDESHYNPIGTVHGGFHATLLDSVCGCAVHTTLPVGYAYTTLGLTVNFLRQITAETGPVTAHGWVTKPGSRAAFAEADLRDGEGRLLATASSSCLVFPVPAAEEA